MINGLEKALNLWIELTGVDPNEKNRKYTINFLNNKISDFEIKNLNDELKESLKIDKSYLSTLLLLNSFTKYFFNNRSFTIKEVLENKLEIDLFMSKSIELSDFLNSANCKSPIEEYRNWLLEALKHYGVTNECVYEKVLDDEFIGFLRRDAFRSLESLEVHQFSSGVDKISASKFVTKVHEFWNINSLISLMCEEKTLDGISLNLIKDRVDSSSYFAFGIKKGDNVLVLTDRPHYAHPMEKNMSRRPGRDLDNRISKNHFPYDLLGLGIDSRGDSFVKESDCLDLSVFQSELCPLKDIKDLNANEIIWIIMMFSLIKEKYMDNLISPLSLSYTGDVVYKGNSKEVKSLMSVNKSFELSVLNNSDITKENLEDVWDFLPTGKNDWIENRYKDKVDSVLLNLNGNNLNMPLLLEDNSVLEVSFLEYRNTCYFEKDKYNKPVLQKLDSSYFGSKEDILYYQKWVARYNQALVIQQEAEKEFKERKSEVIDFVKTRVLNNLDFLLNCISNESLIVPSYKEDGFGYKKEISNILRLLENDDRIYDYKTIKLATTKNNNYYCVLSGAKAFISGKFSPRTPEALSILCGCEVSELPDVLQYWTPINHYSGNSILDNIDPMEWVVSNPWKDLNFSVEVFLSKRAYNQLKKSKS